MKKILRIALLFCLAPLAVAAAGSPALLITDAWIRALPPGQPNTAAYMTLTNSGTAAVVVIGASTEIARKAEIHTTVEVDGLQRMEQLAQLSIAPGESVALAPGGTHLMLLGLARRPAPGDEIGLCLQLEAAEQVCTTADVRMSAGAGQSHDHHH